jgi:hypothetical protein
MLLIVCSLFVLLWGVLTRFDARGSPSIWCIDQLTKVRKMRQALRGEWLYWTSVKYDPFGWSQYPIEIETNSPYKFVQIDTSESARLCSRVVSMVYRENDDIDLSDINSVLRRCGFPKSKPIAFDVSVTKTHPFVQCTDLKTGEKFPKYMRAYVEISLNEKSFKIQSQDGKMIHHGKIKLGDISLETLLEPFLSYLKCLEPKK